MLFAGEQMHAFVEELDLLENQTHHESRFQVLGRTAFILPRLIEFKYSKAAIVFLLARLEMSSSSSIVFIPADQSKSEFANYLRTFCASNLLSNSIFISYPPDDYQDGISQKRTAVGSFLLEAIKIFKPKLIFSTGHSLELGLAVLAARKVNCPIVAELVADTKPSADGGVSVESFRGLGAAAKNNFNSVIRHLHVLFLDKLSFRDFSSADFDAHVVSYDSDLTDVWNLLHNLVDRIGVTESERKLDSAEAGLAIADTPFLNLRSTGEDLLRDLERQAVSIPDSNGSQYYSTYNLSVAIVTDEFMYNYYKDAFAALHYVSPSNYLEVFDSQSPDVFLFVSCWHGLGNQEWTGVAFTDSLQQCIRDILHICKERGIPTIFQSIEDPSNYHTFVSIAKGFDTIFTTDIGKIDDYRNECENARVYFGDYGVNPSFNNPLGHRKVRINGAFFAGSYPARYKERCHDMESLFDSLLSSTISLTIANRNSDDRVSTYQFPERYDPYIVPKISHKLLQKLHKLFRTNINFNSIKHSMTMCAMRVYELQAQGSSIISNYSMSVANRFPNLITHNDHDTHELQFVEIADEDHQQYEREVRGIRNIFTDKTVFEKSAYMLSCAGLQACLPTPRILVLCENISDSVLESFHRQTFRFRVLYTLSEYEQNMPNDFEYIAYFVEDTDYECDYLQGMLNAFKYTKSQYVTKHSFFLEDRHVEGPENKYTEVLEIASLSLFASESFTHEQILSFCRSDTRISLSNGYCADPFGANYHRFLNGSPKLSRIENSKNISVSVIVPLHDINEQFIYRVMDGLNCGSDRLRIQILFWVSKGTAVPTGSLLGLMATSYKNVEVVRSELSAGRLVQLISRCRGEYVNFRLPDVQSSPDYLETLWRARSTCADMEISPSIIGGREKVVGDRVSEDRYSSNVTSGLLGLSQQTTFFESMTDFPLSCSLIAKSAFLNAAKSLGAETQSAQLLGQMSKKLQLFCNGIYEIVDLYTVRYQSNFPQLATYSVREPKIEDYVAEEAIYFLYGDKWRISAEWSGASVNVINEMFALSHKYAVYYNDIYINDLFSADGVLDEHRFDSRYQHVVDERKPLFSSHLPKIIRPSRNYLASFYRGSDSDAQSKFFLVEVLDPKIYGHNYVQNIWNTSRVGFQNTITRQLANACELSSIGDDGTLGYKAIESIPDKSFIRHQSIAMIPLKRDVIDQVSRAAREENRQTLKAGFVIGIGGTVTPSSYPASLLVVMRNLRKLYPEKNISLLVFALNITEDLPDEDWIHVRSYSKSEQVRALLSVDVLVNPWKEKSQRYFASNRTLDAISLGIPYISPRTPARIEQLGEDYTLFHDFSPSEGRYSEEVELQLETLLVKCMDSGYKAEIRGYLLQRRERFLASNIVREYEQQIQSLYDKAILVVAAGLGVGGVEKYTKQILECIKHYDVTLYCADTLSTRALDEVHSISPFIEVISSENFLRDTYDFAFLNSFPVSQNEIDQWMSRLLDSQCKIYPIVHTDIHQFTVGIAKHLENISGIITVAEKIVEKLEQNTGVALNHKSHLITPVLPLSDYFSSQPKTESSRKIGYFGRIVPIKGAHFLVRSFCRLIREHPHIDYELHIYGPFAKDSYYREVLDCIDAAVAGRVSIHNQEYSAEESKAIVKELDLLVYTTMMDGLPYTFLESMAAGTPVVSTNVGGIEHLLKDGRNASVLEFRGLFVEDLFSENPYNDLLDIVESNNETFYKEFEAKMLPLLIDFALIQKYSAAGIEFCRREFSLPVMVRSFKNLVDTTSA